MQTILEAIQKFPNEFASTAAARSCTTPSEINKRHHLKLQQAIQTKDWDKVKEVIKDPSYYSGLRGIVYCLSHYSPIEMRAHHAICELMDQNQIA